MNIAKSKCHNGMKIGRQAGVKLAMAYGMESGEISATSRGMAIIEISVMKMKKLISVLMCKFILVICCSWKSVQSVR